MESPCQAANRGKFWEARVAILSSGYMFSSVKEFNYGKAIDYGQTVPSNRLFHQLLSASSQLSLSISYLLNMWTNNYDGDISAVFLTNVATTRDWSHPLVSVVISNSYWSPMLFKTYCLLHGWFGFWTYEVNPPHFSIDGSKTESKCNDIQPKGNLKKMKERLINPVCTYTCNTKQTILTLQKTITVSLGTFGGLDQTHSNNFTQKNTKH